MLEQISSSDFAGLLIAFLAMLGLYFVVYLLYPSVIERMEESMIDRQNR